MSSLYSLPRALSGRSRPVIRPSAIMCSMQVATASAGGCWALAGAPHSARAPSRLATYGSVVMSSDTCLRDQEVEDLRSGPDVRAVQLGEPAVLATDRGEPIGGDVERGRQQTALGSHLLAAVLGAAALRAGERGHPSSLCGWVCRRECHEIELQR